MARASACTASRKRSLRSAERRGDIDLSGILKPQTRYDTETAGFHRNALPGHLIFGLEREDEHVRHCLAAQPLAAKCLAAQRQNLVSRGLADHHRPFADPLVPGDVLPAVAPDR